MNFEELNVKPEIVKALKEVEITEPTEIQEKAIPAILQRKDDHMKKKYDPTKKFKDLYAKCVLKK